MSKKTKMLVGVSIVLIAIISIAVLATNNSKPEKEIVGSWQLAEVDNSHDYPVQLIFYDNGTFMSEDLEDFGIYLIDDNYITTKYDGTVLWDYELLSKNKLMLHCTISDYQGYIEYERVESTVITTVEHTTESRVVRSVEGEKRWSN